MFGVVRLAPMPGETQRVAAILCQELDCNLSADEHLLTWIASMRAAKFWDADLGSNRARKRFHGVETVLLCGHEECPHGVPLLPMDWFDGHRSGLDVDLTLAATVSVLTEPRYGAHRIHTPMGGAITLESHLNKLAELAERGISLA
jgi:hypothetical protein